jgi:hypothetical protein
MTAVVVLDCTMPEASTGVCMGSLVTALLRPAEPSAGACGRPAQ